MAAYPARDAQSENRHYLRTIFGTYNTGLVRMDLKDSSISFTPTLGSNAKGTGTRDLTVRWMGQMINVATLVKRLDSGDGDYLNDIQEDIELKTLVNAITRNVLENERLCEDFRDKYDAYGYLWRESVDENFKSFVRENTLEGQKYPPLKKFDEMIVKYKTIEDEVRVCPTACPLVGLRLMPVL